MSPEAWCPNCEMGVPSDHDASICHNCGRLFCESLGDVMLGLCEDCIKDAAKSQK